MTVTLAKQLQRGDPGCDGVGRHVDLHAEFSIR